MFVYEFEPSGQATLLCPSAVCPVAVVEVIFAKPG